MAFEQVGVEAIVKGLGAFQSDMGKINSSLQNLRGEGSLLQRAFGSITDGILGFGEHIARVAEVALGTLLRDAVNAAIDFVKDLVNATIEAGHEFQTLEIRLERLNFNTLIESGADYNEAAREAVQLTQEQLTWLQKLAAQSPYDSKDVANTYTLARSYGFAADEAQHLTSNILDFAAGMGLGETEIQRIIVNFGQMTQQGKVTQRELNDLARGAFVPVNDVLKIMQERTGLAGKEFDTFKNSTEGVNMFMGAFSELVEQRFAGATEQMSQTFKGATSNVLDLVKGIFGLNTVKPVLDVIGKRAAAFANSFTDDPERWDRLVNAASRLGEALSSILTGIFDLLPGTDNLAENVIQVVEKAAQWVEDNRENIIGFFKNIADTIKNDVIPWIQGSLVPAFEKFVQWFIDNKEEILQFFIDMATAIKDDLIPFIKEHLIPAIYQFGDWFIENKDQIVLLFDKLGDVILDLAEFILPKLQAAMAWISEHPELVEKLIAAWAKWQFIGTILDVVGGIILSVVGFIMGLISAAAGVIAVLSTGIPQAIALAVLAFLQLKFMIEWVRNGIETAINFITSRFNAWVTDVYSKIEEARQAIIRGDWLAAGKAIIQGMINGVKWMIGSLVEAVKAAAQSAYNAAMAALGIHSPSTLFFEIGAQTMQGLAIGIQKSAGLAATAMQSAMAQVTASSAPSVTNSTVYNNTANYNLTVNSSAPAEPILQDYAMMQSLAGV